MFIAYTVCNTGHRWFTDTNGVCISFDPKLIQHVIADYDACVQRNKTDVAEMEQQLAEVKQQTPIPPIVERIHSRNRESVKAQISEHKRAALAEAVLNDMLVRDIMWYDNLKDAIAYSLGGA